MLNRGGVQVGRRFTAWWKDAGIDPIKAARKLWKHTRMDEGRIEPEPTAQHAASDRTAKSDVQAVDDQTPVHHD
jgi:hypothetical protein